MLSEVELVLKEVDVLEEVDSEVELVDKLVDDEVD